MTGLRRVDDTHALSYSIDDCKLLIWDVEGEELAGSLVSPDYDKMGRRVATNGTEAVSTDSNLIYVHDIETGKLLLEFPWVDPAYARFN